MINNNNRKVNDIYVNLDGFIRVDGALCLPDSWVMAGRIDDTALMNWVRVRIARAVPAQAKKTYQVLLSDNEFRNDFGFVDSVDLIQREFESGEGYAQINWDMSNALRDKRMEDTNYAFTAKFTVFNRMIGATLTGEYSQDMNNDLIPLLDYTQVELVNLIGQDKFAALRSAAVNDPVPACMVKSIRQSVKTDAQLAKALDSLNVAQVTFSVADDMFIDAPSEGGSQWDNLFTDAHVQQDVDENAVESSELNIDDDYLRNAALREIPSAFNDLHDAVVDGVNDYESYRKIVNILAGNMDTPDDLHMMNVNLHAALDEMLYNADYDFMLDEKLPSQVKFVSNLLAIVDGVRTDENCAICGDMRHVYVPNRSYKAANMPLFAQYIDAFRRILNGDEFDAAMGKGFAK